MIKKFIGEEFAANTYIIVEDNKCVIIDPTIGFNKKVIEEYTSGLKIVGVLLTHAHIDHIDGVRHLLEYPIYISSIEYNYINNSGYNLYGWYGEKIPYDTSKMNFNLLNDGDTINILNEPIKAILTPGHTLGGMSYSYRDKLFTGDTLFKLSVGRSDISAGNEESLYKSIDKLMHMFKNNTKIYPGHGELTTIHDELTQNPYYLMYLKRKK